MQTIHTCLYVHNMDILNKRESFAASARSKNLHQYPVELMTSVLHAFLRGCLKTCDIVMEEMLKGNLYDVCCQNALWYIYLKTWLYDRMRIM